MSDSLSLSGFERTSPRVPAFDANRGWAPDSNYVVTTDQYDSFGREKEQMHRCRLLTIDKSFSMRAQGACLYPTMAPTNRTTSPMCRSRLGQAAMICAIVGAACQGPEEGVVAEVVFADSAGVVVVSNPSPEAGTVPAWIMAPEPTITIGSEDGEAAYVFSGVSGAAVLPDQRVIVVADRASAQLRFFGIDGGHLRTVGGRGGGPGEFQQLYLAGRIGTDSVLAVDALKRRGVVYDASGRRVREFGFSDDFPRAAPSGILTEGRLVADPQFQNDISPRNSDQISGNSGCCQ